MMSEIRDVFISKVALENFLSFEKDDIDFGNSKFNLVIGPNWSGKTSIFQAIKFGLGSNERDERYAKWSDFIRTGQNHAMVELTIQDRGKPIQLRRTVIRGNSPFFSLKQWGDKKYRKVKSHEVQKITRELNYSPDNHFAFVSQGKVDAIKNLKPVELCAFLEEGIGLKGLRDEILQEKGNVGALHNDLSSLVSKKNTLNMSLDLLKPKLERLKEKKKLINVRKQYEDELLQANREKIKEEIKDLKKNILISQETIKNFNSELEACIKDIKIVRELIDKNLAEINDFSQKTGELNYQKKQLVSKIQDWQNEKVLAKKELEDLKKFIGKKEKEYQNLNDQKESLVKQNDLILGERNDLDAKIEALIREQSELMQKSEHNKDFLDQYNKTMSEKNQKERSLQEAQELIKEINDEINQIFQSLKEIDHKMDKNKWFLENPSKDLMAKFDNELGKLSAKIYSLDFAIKQMEKEKSDKIRKLKVLQSSIKKRKLVLPANITILKEEIRNRGLNAKGPIIDYLKYGDELSYAIESVVGEKLLYSFVTDNWETLELLKRLKSKYNAYCNVYVSKNLNISPLSEISAKGVVGYLAELVKVVDNDADIRKVIYSKVSNCIVVEDFASGRDLYKNYNFKGMCVTLKGEQLRSYKYVYETPYVKQLKGLLSAGTQKEQSQILEDEVSNLNEEISNLKLEQSKLDNIQKEVFRKKEVFNDLLYNFHQKQRLTTKKNQLYENIYALEKNISHFQEEIEEYHQKINEFESKKDPELFNITQRINQIPLELSNLHEKKKKWDKKLEETRDSFLEIEKKVIEFSNEIESFKRQYEKKKEEFHQADKDAFKIYQELEKVEELLNTTEERLQEIKYSTQEAQQEKNRLDKKSIQLEFDLEQESNKLNALELEIQSKQSDLERINLKLGENKDFIVRPIRDIKDDMKKIDKQLLNYMDVDETLLIERDRLIDGLKQIMKNQDDLEKDIKAAKKTEKKLEKTYYNKFKGVLEDLKNKINYKFESSEIKTYCSLDLVGKFEELGVEIKAATSKEDLKSCTALSGGQISMVSICLILSLQEIKPSPLCMLDEAGMFLDDKNSEVAYHLIKSTLEQNPVQMIMFMPKTSNSLYFLAEKVIGVARTGNKEVSTIFRPKIVKK